MKKLVVELQPYGSKNLDGYRKAVEPPIQKLPKICHWLWPSVLWLASLNITSIKTEEITKTNKAELLVSKIYSISSQNT
jgi:hypothetical protein